MPRMPVSAALLVSVVVLASSSMPPLAAVGPQGASVVRTPAEASYDVHLRAGAGGRSWRGRGSVTFTNVGTGTLPEVYLRVWSNGVLGCDPRSITVSNVQGGALTGEALDCTELEVTLDDALAPGERTTIGYDLRIRLPDENDRFGFHHGLALAGTALPILSVHDDRGWHREPFENLGESFYSIVSDYEVTLVTPPGLDTAATGVAVRRIEDDRGSRATTYRATAVRDFAWAAGALHVIRRTVGGVAVRVSYQRERVSDAQARSAAAFAADTMRTFEEAFGRYPYPEIDVVLTGPNGFGGMEYPAIVYSEPFRSTIAHELAHQWFYGIVGNDQYHEPWLDESFATWAARLPLGRRGGCAGIAWPGPDAAFTNDMGYWSTHPGQYPLVYTGGACMLANLAQRFGRERFVRIVGRYADRHRLGIARTEDLTAAVEAAAARHLEGFDAEAYWRRWRVEGG